MSTRDRFLSKLVVRNLPIGLDEAGFRALVGENVFQNVDFFYYVPGKARPKSVDVMARAYLNFTNQAALLSFNEKLDGHTFLDSKGNSICCTVEYAQSQLKPKKVGLNKRPPKSDPLVNTIEADESYKQFLEELNAPVQPATSDLEPVAPRGLTPLLVALKQKDQEKLQAKLDHKKNKKKAKKAAAVPAKPTAAATPKRKKNKKKKKVAEPGPQFGAVKILGTNNSTAASPSSAPPSAPPVSAPAATSSEPKKKRHRRPKPKKTAAEAQAKKTPPKT